MKSDLIIRMQNIDGKFRCERFESLPSPQSVYIAICFTDNQGSLKLANQLKTVLIERLRTLNNGVRELEPLCSPNSRDSVGINQCQSVRAPETLKLLIVVSDGNTNVFQNQAILQWKFKVLPVLKEGTNVTLPSPLNTPNAVFWKKDVVEVVPAILAIIGVSPEERKLFISYRRSDTSDFAEQLFDTLGHEGFEVFLDRFSINPGVNFQERLFQELADKAMILLIESPSYLQSQWVQYEIDFAKKYRLGIFAIHVAGSPKTLTIDDEYRFSINLNTAMVVDSHDLSRLVNEVNTKHSMFLYRKRAYLSESIFQALKFYGCDPSFDAYGFITVENKDRTIKYKILAAPRPASLNDYYLVECSGFNDKKVLISPKFMESHRDVVNSWLSRKSEVDFFEEGSILHFAASVCA